MKDWPEKPYLEPKTEGRTYLEWLYQPRRSAEADLARLRQLWKDEPRVREQLVQLAKQYRHHGTRALRLAQVPGCQAALRAAVQGIISKGLA
jgi:CHASE3 domain sensor protein